MAVQSEQFEVIRCQSSNQVKCSKSPRNLRQSRVASWTCSSSISSSSPSSCLSSSSYLSSLSSSSSSPLPNQQSPKTQRNRIKVNNDVVLKSNKCHTSEDSLELSFFFFLSFFLRFFFSGVESTLEPESDSAAESSDSSEGVAFFY